MPQAEPATHAASAPGPLAHLALQAEGCTRCALSASATHKVTYRASDEGVPYDVLFLGEAPGVVEDQAGLPFCLGEEMRVLMADLTWRRIIDVQVGDAIIAPDEKGEPGFGVSKKRARRYRIAVVTGKYESTQDRIELFTHFGNLVLTPDHVVLAQSSIGRHKWLPARKLHVTGGERCSGLSLVAVPWATRQDRQGGYIAGFFDGEGHVAIRRSEGRKSFQVGCSQKKGELSTFLAALTRDAGFSLTKAIEQRQYNGTIQEHYNLLGGLPEIMRFLGSIRPMRLLSKFLHAFEEYRPEMRVRRAQVFKRATIGKGRVVDLQTTTGTLIAEGFVVHNCGNSGQVLQKWIDLLGVERWIISNVAWCKPPNLKGKWKPRAPRPEETSMCVAVNVGPLISIASPKAIVCVGSVARDALKPHLVSGPRLLGFLGYWGHVPVWHVRHPSYYLHQGLLWEEDVLRLRDHLAQVVGLSQKA